jgi:hypothetical protein
MNSIWDQLASDCRDAKKKAFEYRRLMRNHLNKAEIIALFSFFNTWSQNDAEGWLRLNLLRRMSDLDIVNIIDEKTKYRTKVIQNAIEKRLKPNESKKGGN